MTLEIQMDGSAWDEILSSLHKVASGEEDIPMDVNIVATSDNKVQIYVRNYQNLQVLHELVDTGIVSVNASESTRLVFDSEILRSVIQQAKSRKISLQFDEHTFDVEVGEQSFSTPTTLELRLVHASQFQDSISIEESKRVGSLKRKALLDNLNIFESIAKVVNFKVENGTFEISVSDKVQGKGNVEADVSEDCEIEFAEGKYKIRPLKDFLTQMQSEYVDIKMTELATLEIRSSSTGRTSELLLAPRKDSIG